MNREEQILLDEIDTIKSIIHDKQKKLNELSKDIEVYKLRFNDLIKQKNELQCIIECK